MNDFERTFDNNAENYDHIRPDYKREIYDDIFSYKPINVYSTVLEVGMGTGKATQAFLDSSCNLIGIEPGENLIRIAIERYRNYANFAAVCSTLQDFDYPTEAFDLIYAATAFHWIPEEYGYKRVFQLLKSGGVFARFAYHACGDKTSTSLNKEINGLYAKYMNRNGNKKEFSEANAKNLTDIANRYGFKNTQYRLYETTKDFTADEYMKLLETYPDHMGLDEYDRKKLFSGIHSAITNHGNILTMHYIMDLELATKP